jgi:hypothetical protein
MAAGRTSNATGTSSTGQQRTRQTSQTSAAVRSTATAAASSTTTLKSLGSPAPSEDSGVGLYRQMLAKDPSLHNSPP